MKLHPREKLIDAAEEKLRTAVVEATRELTLFESIQVVTRIFSNEILGTCKYQIRIERHGDPDMPGGLEG